MGPGRAPGPVPRPQREGPGLCLGAAYLAGYLYWETVRRRAVKIPAGTRSGIEDGAMFYWRYPEHAVFLPVGLIVLANFLVPVEWYTPQGAEGSVSRALAALAYGFFVVGAGCLIGRVLSRRISGKALEFPEA